MHTALHAAWEVASNIGTSKSALSHARFGRDGGFASCQSSGEVVRWSTASVERILGWTGPAHRPWVDSDQALHCRIAARRHAGSVRRPGTCSNGRGVDVCGIAWSGRSDRRTSSKAGGALAIAERRVRVSQSGVGWGLVCSPPGRVGLQGRYLPPSTSCRYNLSDAGSADTPFTARHRRLERRC